MIKNDREYLEALERAESNGNKFAEFVSKLEKTNSGSVSLEKAYFQLREDISDIEEYQKSFSSDEWYDGFRMDPSETRRGIPALEGEVWETVFKIKIDEDGKSLIRGYTKDLLTQAKKGVLPSSIGYVRCICNEFTVRDRNRGRIGNQIWFPKEAAVYLAKLRYLLKVINLLSTTEITADNNNDVVVYYK